MGSDISGFKNILAGYKATISIAIADVNLYGFVVFVVFCGADFYLQADNYGYRKRHPRV